MLGPIPAEVAQLKQLRELHLSGNCFTGEMGKRRLICILYGSENNRELLKKNRGWFVLHTYMNARGGLPSVGQLLLCVIVGKKDIFSVY